jgi:glycosyltransferase involved in cell wall biosynthesis
MNNGEDITILMPCKDQKKEFLIDAIDSVLKQTSPHWRLLVIVDPHTPAKVNEVIDSFRDYRIKTLVSCHASFGGALNAGIGHSDTDYVCILLSDDKLDRSAVEILQGYIKRFPDVDFFYSSRRYIDARGQIRTPIMRSREQFYMDDFKKIGSPVKHLLCWRRVKGVEIGGMDETLSLHGCDDYDFPWRMAEAGAKFKAIKQCLYYYRIHHDFHRNTTHVPTSTRVENLTTMFRKHGVSEQETSEYIQNALKGYLVKDQLLSYEADRGYILGVSCYREIGEDRAKEFLRKGYKRRYFFPHRIYYLPKGGPDGLKMANQLCKIKDPRKLWEIVLYGLPPTIDEFPEALFFDNDLVWHQQHFGKAGQIATANFVVDGNRLYGMNYLSDLVQRISRAREYKTRVENRFKGWNRLLLNAMMNFASERGLRVLYSPTADLMLKNADPSRKVQRELFDRIYDRTVCEHLSAEKEGEWWRIDVLKHKDKVIVPMKKQEIIERGKTICVCHDIERGFGHLLLDPDFASSVNGPSHAALETMLGIEKSMGVKATYHVLGCLLTEVRKRIESDGHACAFHSYDHKVDNSYHPLRPYEKILYSMNRFMRVRLRNRWGFELSRCRLLDYRVKGYRPVQSKITSELSEGNLSFYNFEWLASSSSSLKVKLPRMQNGIVKIPILFDDFDLYKKGVSFQDWEEKAIDTIKENDFVAFCLHDCYAQYWLPHYKNFLEKIRHLGNFKTLDEVSAEVILCSAQ